MNVTEEKKIARPQISITTSEHHHITPPPPRHALHHGNVNLRLAGLLSDSVAVAGTRLFHPIRSGVAAAEVGSGDPGALRHVAPERARPARQRKLDWVPAGGRSVLDGIGLNCDALVYADEDEGEGDWLILESAFAAASYMCGKIAYNELDDLCGRVISECDTARHGKQLS